MLQQIKKDLLNYNEKKEEILRVAILTVILGVVVFFGEGFRAGKAETIIWVVIWIVSIMVMILHNVIRIKFHYFAFWCILFLGTLSLLVQPIMNIPDEVAHFARTEIITQGHIFIEPSEQKFETIESVNDLHSDLGKTIISSELKEKEIDYTPYTFLHVAATNASFLYFPQAIGMIVAKVLHLNVIWLLWLGRLTNLLFYCCVICWAIKLTPKLKFPLFFVACLPMSIQQAASYSPDAMINSLAILLVSFFIELYAREDQRIGKRDVIYFIVLSVLVTVAKVTNICIVGLFMLVPLRKAYGKKKAIAIKALVIGAVIVIGVLYYFYTTTFAMNLDTAPYFAENNIDVGQQIKFISADILGWLQHFGGSSIELSENYLNMLNRYGWLNYGYAFLTPVSIFVFGKICFQEKGIGLRGYEKFLIFLMIVGIYGMVNLAMYLTWTPVGSATIAGVQGRYFIPLFSLLVLLFCNLSETRENLNKNDILIVISMVGSYLITTAVHYY